MDDLQLIGAQLAMDHCDDGGCLGVLARALIAAHERIRELEASLMRVSRVASLITPPLIADNHLWHGTSVSVHSLNHRCSVCDAVAGLLPGDIQPEPPK